MSILNTLITDRTEQDAILAASLNARGLQNMTIEEQAFYVSAANKGTYKALDFNRVTQAALYVQARLADAGVSVALTDHRWTDSEIQTADRLEAYRQNIIALRSALAVLPGTPPVPESIPALTIEEANHIEQILLNIDSMLDLMAAAPIFSGEIYAGEV